MHFEATSFKASAKEAQLPTKKGPLNSANYLLHLQRNKKLKVFSRYYLLHIYWMCLNNIVKIVIWVNYVLSNGSPKYANDSKKALLLIDNCLGEKKVNRNKALTSVCLKLISACKNVVNEYRLYIIRREKQRNEICRRRRIPPTQINSRLNLHSLIRTLNTRIYRREMC